MKILRVEKLTDHRWLNLYLADFENRGHSGKWIFASRRPEPHAGLVADAVVLIPVLRNPGEEPRLVMIREYRVPAGDYVLGLPAGLIDPGEAIEECVRRELHEETGLRVAGFRQVSQPLFNSSGMSDETACLAFIDAEGTPCVDHLEASEDIEVVLATIDDVRRILADKTLYVDAKVWTILYMYAQIGSLV